MADRRYKFEEAATIKLMLKLKNEIKERSCLKCSKTFKSLGKNNRICDTCNHNNASNHKPMWE